MNKQMSTEVPEAAEPEMARGCELFSGYKNEETVLVGRARVLCQVAHAGQIRKYTGERYENHPFEVARRVARVGGSPAMIAAALLHDVVEDSEYSIGFIARHFPRQVAEMVGELTGVPSGLGYSRRARKAMDRARMAAASEGAQTIKLADISHNTESIVVHDPRFSRVYLTECAGLLSILDRGDQGLWRSAYEGIKAGADQIGILLPGADRLDALARR
ncbi:HD domain-containing protein [Salinisphaera sp. P385]|uniref:HD domain-containing protein n=1 Tax=Spectribacter acetivorans TaxID=3075603 RepID=A0ABU3B7M6_9GAMM|nr:HD domain-containing protein [Salinisphaera sp. P385]MDT0618473.1 HD domain-containing protein [Salinisphaera sp. P385]